jgi:YHS domain-containing protein
MATAIDPICQMDVDTDNPPGGQSEHDGTTYYFCAPGCKVAFDKEPEKYVSEAHDHGDHDEHEGHDHGGHDEHEGHDHGAHEEPAAEAGHDDHDDHDHGPGGHSHGHHMPDAPAQTTPTASKPGFFARLFGKK